MKRFGKLAIGALMAGGAALAVATPAAARPSIGISFGFGLPGYANFGACDYYDYYNAPPPWGLPPNYCNYNVYFQPIYWNGEWYRGPVYYRFEGGRRVFWLNGSWRRADWRHRPSNIQWRERGRQHFRHNYRHRGYQHGGYYHQQRGNRGYRGGYEHGGFRVQHQGNTHYEHHGLRNTNFRGQNNRGATQRSHERGGQNQNRGDRHHRGHDRNGHS
jgi:hypothetical protein